MALEETCARTQIADDNYQRCCPPQPVEFWIPTYTYADKEIATLSLVPNFRVE